MNTFQSISSRESLEVSSFCHSSSDVTLSGFPYQSTRVLEGGGVSVLVCDVDVDSGLDWEILLLLF